MNINNPTNIPRIMCAVCKKPVDYVERYRDELNQRDRYIAKCHGKQEIADLTDEQLINANSIEGLAFSTKKLEKE